ncbi:CinA family protein [Pseudomonadota bacterium]
MFSKKLIKKAQKLIKICREKNIKVVTAESCTGGLVSTLITSISGSSAVFDRGFVTYSNEAKMELLEVDRDVLQEKGAVSKEVSNAMVMGALANSNANLGVSITGIAGPNGGTEKKPVGLVHISACINNTVLQHKRNIFKGSREEIRNSSTETAIDMMLSLTDRSI